MADLTALRNMEFVLKRNVKDNMGQKHKFGLYPAVAGGINYFDSISDLSRFERKVQVKRSWENKYPLNVEALE